MGGLKAKRKEIAQIFSVLEGNIEVDRSFNPERPHYRVVLARHIKRLAFHQYTAELLVFFVLFS